MSLNPDDIVDLETISQGGDAMMTMQESIAILSVDDSIETVDAVLNRFRAMSEFQKEISVCFLLGRLVEVPEV